MIPGNATRFALMAAATLLLGTLVFLFAKTQSADYKNAAEAVALLRELRDVDARWDSDALRLANDLAQDPVSIPDRSAMVARILHELQQDSVRAALGPRLDALRSGVAEKQAAYRALAVAHGRSRQALVTARDALGALFMEASARGQRPAASTLLGQVEHLRLELRGMDIEYHAQLERDLEPRIASLVPAALAVDPLIGATARKAQAAARDLVETRAREAAAWRKLSLLTVGARIDMATRELSGTIETALADKDRWRIYLVAYAAALLLGVGYLALRVLRAQAALRHANQELENRVAQRTRELSRALQQLKDSEAQLVQTEKMSSLGQLVAGVAHEINTPLAYVKNSMASVRDRMAQLRETLDEAERLMSMLESESPAADELQEAFATLSLKLRALAEHQVLFDLDALTADGLHGIEQITELVTNLRNFARLDRSKVASFNVNESVRAALMIARPLLRKVEVERRLADLPSVTCSPSQINQVLLNLLTNSAQAMDKADGRIVVATRREGADRVAIEVIDNGRGIPAENLGRIFDPFFTTKEVGSGTGLGLSIAYKIVAEHGGRIDVRSRPGEGSTFTVVLPIVPPGEPATALAQQEAA